MMLISLLRLLTWIKWNGFYCFLFSASALGGGDGGRMATMQVDLHPTRYGLSRKYNLPWSFLYRITFYNINLPFVHRSFADFSRSFEDCTISRQYPPSLISWPPPPRLMRLWEFTANSEIFRNWTIISGRLPFEKD